jgi:hypothetical protein
MKNFKWVIQSNQIKDCPVTVDDVVNANKIWGKDIPAFKERPHITRKLVTTWNASTPLRSGANTKQPLNFSVLLLKYNAQPNQANIVK